MIFSIGSCYCYAHELSTFAHDETMYDLGCLHRKLLHTCRFSHGLHAGSVTLCEGFHLPWGNCKILVCSLNFVITT